MLGSFARRGKEDSRGGEESEKEKFKLSPGRRGILDGDVMLDNQFQKESADASGFEGWGRGCLLTRPRAKY